ncbi:hypothetical protein H5410_002980, partial [Solanum commersonii]
ASGVQGLFVQRKQTLDKWWSASCVLWRTLKCTNLHLVGNGERTATQRHREEEISQVKHSGQAQRKLELNSEAPEAPLSNFFSTNLTYTPPVIVEGEKVVEILTEDVAQDNEKWAPSIVVYMVGKTPSIGAVERFILGQGTFSAKPVILYHRDGYFVLRFANEEEWDMVPCLVPQFNSKEEILTTTPLWIKLPNLPLNCWNPKVLSKMGSSFGKPQYADECTTQVNRISFARILVEVDITKPLPKVIKIHVPKGRVLEQKIWFEWKPTFCQKCLQVGHSCVDKLAAHPQVQKKSQGQGQKKEWIPIIVLPQAQEVTDQPEIDVARYNKSWLWINFKKQVMAMDPLFSDLSPLGLIVDEQKDSQKRPFRLYNSIGKHPEFRDRVQADW